MGERAGGEGHGAAENISPRAICLCVDDCGIHSGVDAAALDLADLGRVHAIGCMPGGVSWPAASRRLQALDANEVDLGLHLDFTEHPLLPGSRHDLPALIAASTLRRLDRAHVRDEIRAQLDAFEAALGRAPAFVDGHQHVHQLPQIRDELIAELERRYAVQPVDSRPWLRSTRAGIARIKPWIIAALGAHGLAELACRHGYQQNNHLLGVYNFQHSARRYLGLLAGWLANARDGDLLMCHPATSRAADDPIGEARLAEYVLLAGANFDNLLRMQCVALQPMSRILARGY
jgi:predicted glycoside hydrolase/deacetylase ChbG (UPF0249 family)